MPFGGAKGDVVVDPKDLITDEMGPLTRRITHEIREAIGPKKDIPAPEMGTDPETIARLIDGYSKQQDETGSEIVTGASPNPREYSGRPGPTTRPDPNPVAPAREGEPETREE